MPARPPANKLQPKLCALAESIALEEFDVRLDYSTNSIRDVENILGDIHTYFRETRSDDGMHGIALEFAAYIVSVIQRHFGPATWERDCSSFGKDAFPLQWRGSSLYPYAWCAKRIFDGPADNVWSKFQTLILKPDQKTKRAPKKSRKKTPTPKPKKTSTARRKRNVQKSRRI